MKCFTEDELFQLLQAAALKGMAVSPAIANWRNLNQQEREARISGLAATAAKQVLDDINK